MKWIHQSPPLHKEAGYVTTFASHPSISIYLVYPSYFPALRPSYHTIRAIVLNIALILVRLLTDADARSFHLIFIGSFFD
jgi:hypothetical protein